MNINAFKHIWADPFLVESMVPMQNLLSLATIEPCVMHECRAIISFAIELLKTAVVIEDESKMRDEERHTLVTHIKEAIDVGDTELLPYATFFESANFTLNDVISFYEKLLQKWGRYAHIFTTPLSEIYVYHCRWKKGISAKNYVSQVSILVDNYTAKWLQREVFAG